MMSVIALSIGVVSAACDSSAISIVAPTASSYTNAGTQLINWTLNADCNIYEFNLRYSLGACTNVEYKVVDKAFASGETEYTWDISSLDTGEYCVKVYREGSIVNDDVSFTIDRTAPNVTFNSAPYSVVKGNSVSISATIVDGKDLSKYIIKFNSTDTGKEVALTTNPKTISEPYTYTESGEYVVTIIAYDKAGNTKTATTNVVVSDTAPDWVISLSSASPNLISIPYVPEDTGYKTVFEGVRDKLDRVWSYEYDSVKKENVWKYRQTTATSWSTAGSLSEIVPGRAYYVFMNSDDVLYGNKKTSSSSSSSEPVSPLSVKLANEYNLIAMFGDPTVKTVDSVLSSLKSLNDKPYWYKVLDKNENEVLITADLTVGKGYWISMKHLPDTATEDYYTYFP